MKYNPTALKRAGRWLLIFGTCYIFLNYIRPRLSTSSEQESAPIEQTESAEQAQLPEASHPTPSPAEELSSTDRLELPKRSTEATSRFVTHYVDGRVNYSLEYDLERRHARWVAFSFDNYTAQRKVGRSDAWCWDPKLPKEYNTEMWFRRSGYTRGHLVASEDRTYSQQANQQTFYYSNMSPQLEEHNSGIWVRIEQLIQRWGRDRELRDVLYVAKGGTIKDGQIRKERIRGKMVIPKYYWAAVLLKKGNEYHSIAFWTEHRDYERGRERLRDLAISVDRLETLTGLDLFHNLPDEIEDAVEAEDPNDRIARTTWWN